MILLLFSILAGILYRLGGTGGAWWKNTKVRDIGVPLCMLGYFLSIGVFHWSLLVATVVMFGACTSYFKKGDTMYWYHWMFVGLALSLSMFPFTLYNWNWLGLAARMLTTTVAIVIWSESISDPNVEEFGRGFFTIVTLPLLLTGSI